VRLLVELALVSVRSVELGAQRASLRPVEIEGIGEFLLIAGLCFRVVQGGHPVTLAVGWWSVQGHIAGPIGPLLMVGHYSCLFASSGYVKSE
jgi:hypothetical protein